MIHRIHIFFLLRSLYTGGTERQAVELAKGLDKDTFEITVCLFYDEGELRSDIREIEGVRLLSLNKSGRWDLWGCGIRLIRLLRKYKPTMLYSFLPEANIAGLIAARLAKVPVIIWGIRASNMDVRYYNWLVNFSIRLTTLLSRFPDAIIANSFSGFSYHKSMGFYPHRMSVIPNGIDIDRFAPNRACGSEVRQEWGIDEKTLVIGLVGRLDPMKGHITFLKAAKIFISRHNDAKFICVGDGSGIYKDRLHTLAELLGLSQYLVWAGKRNDMLSVYNALDIVTSSSCYGEGFPNVIGEAMACGVPCVVTDVGDAALIVGDTGVVVPKDDPEALANGWAKMLEKTKKDPESYSRIARNRIVSAYNKEILLQKTTDSLLNMLKFYD